MLIKFIYTLFLALLIALFVGLGIESFYQEPKAPEYPMNTIMEKQPGCEPNVEQQKLEKEYTILRDKYTKELKTYNKNVSIVLLIIAIVILVLSLTFMTKIKMISDGILLGGVFTTAYGIIRGIMSDSSQFRFLIVTVGLTIALVLGYMKFIRPKEENILN